MERDNLIQIVTLIIAIVALILAVFAVAVPGNDEDEDDDGDQEVNTPPSAVLGSSTTTVQIGEYINLDGSGSSDSDGNIIEYTWDLGNGMKDSGIYTLYLYSESGMYTVTLTVIDDNGAKDNATTTITVLPNEAPEAMITMDATSFDVGENAYFNASGSSDSDGKIVEYTWDFGDGTKDSGMYSNHIFQEEGVFSVSLTVIDDDGASDVDSVDVTVIETGGPPTNDPPVAKIETEKTEIEADEHLIFDGRNSTDPEGDVIVFMWDMDDGMIITDVVFSYYYETPGIYNITLKVYDNHGASDTTNFTLVVTPSTPIGDLGFTKTAPGNYTGGIVYLSYEPLYTDISLLIIDETNGLNATQVPIQSGVPVQVGSGFKLTVTDNNANGKLDAGDVWTVNNGSHGDIIRLIFIPTGKIIAEQSIVDVPPTGALSFNENTPGNYTGGVISLSDTVYVSEASIYIIDTSTGINATHIPIQSGIWLQAGSGLKIKYTDSNSNLKIDAGDVWVIENGGSGDIIKLIYIPTGGTIAAFTL